VKYIEMQHCISR